MNDDLMLEYLLQMGAMQPRQAQNERKQAYVDALRERGMTSPQGQMAGRVYVAPSITQYASQLGHAYMGRKGQDALDKDYAATNQAQADMIKMLRDRMATRRTGTAPVTPQTTMGMSGKGVFNPEDEIFGAMY